MLEYRFACVQMGICMYMYECVYCVYLGKMIYTYVNRDIICLYMYVEVCMCMYECGVYMNMYKYVCICAYRYVYACI